MKSLFHRHFVSPDTTDLRLMSLAPFFDLFGRFADVCLLLVIFCPGLSFRASEAIFDAAPDAAASLFLLGISFAATFSPYADMPRAWWYARYGHAMPL